MKKRICMMILILMALLCDGCGKEETADKELSTESEFSQVEEQSNAASKEYDDIELDDILEVDFTHDYSEDIKEDVDYVVSNSASLQKELENIEKITDKYIQVADASRSQLEMNLSARWFFVIWDTELNNLWSRFSNSADQQTKDKMLEEQRNWVAMKEEVLLLSIGPREEGGSVYPVLQNFFLEEITKNRAYVLANELAKIKGEFFVMPEKSTKYGYFVDNQGTENVYSALITQQGRVGQRDEVIISIYRRGEIEGIFVDNGNGELEFTSDDESIKGIIKIDGWDGASFKITEISGDSVFSIGEEFRFPFVF